MSDTTASNYEIIRLEDVYRPVSAIAIRAVVDDFKHRADGLNIDGWSSDDIIRLMMRTFDHQFDQAWMVFTDGELAGFAALVFGPSLQNERIEAQIVAFYLRPGTPLDVAPHVVAAMKEHARSRGAFRIIAGTQRPVKKAFGRLGARPIGILYEIPIEKESEKETSCHAGSSLEQ